MPVFTDALIGDTLHLSTEEFGAYCLLLFATWRNNGEALPDDAAELAQICRVTPQRWRSHMRPKLSRFFDIGDGRWHQKRLEKEWCAVQTKLEVNRANGARGGRPKNPNSKPNETQEKPTGFIRDNPNDNPNESTHSQSQKLASKANPSQLPKEWATEAARKRTEDGLPEVDLAAEWAKFLAKIDGEPTEGRWLAWAMKARQQRSGNGSTDRSGLPEAPWPQRCRGWAKGHRWDPMHGPAPDEPGCLAPPDLIEEALRQRQQRVA